MVLKPIVGVSHSKIVCTAGKQTTDGPGVVYLKRHSLLYAIVWPNASTTLWVASPHG